MLDYGNTFMEYCCRPEIYLHAPWKYDGILCRSSDLYLLHALRIMLEYILYVLYRRHAHGIIWWICGRIGYNKHIICKVNRLLSFILFLYLTIFTLTRTALIGWYQKLGATLFFFFFSRWSRKNVEKRFQFSWRHMLETSSHCLFMITPPFSWIFTKYANEWPPRKKIRKGSTRKKINTKKEQEVVNTKKDPEVVNTKKKPEVVNTKKETGSDPWPLTLTRKRSTLTTLICNFLFVFVSCFCLFPIEEQQYEWYLHMKMKQDASLLVTEYSSFCTFPCDIYSSKNSVVSLRFVTLFGTAT